MIGQRRTSIKMSIDWNQLHWFLNTGKQLVMSRKCHRKKIMVQPSAFFLIFSQNVHFPCCNSDAKMCTVMTNMYNIYPIILANLEFNYEKEIIETIDFQLHLLNFHQTHHRDNFFTIWMRLDPTCLWRN